MHVGTIQCNGVVSKVSNSSTYLLVDLIKDECRNTEEMELGNFRQKISNTVRRPHVTSLVTEPDYDR